MSETYQDRNRASRERLGVLASRLNAADLARPLEGGWTVKALLAHLAFWDRYAHTVLTSWASDGFKPMPSVAGVVNAAAIDGWRHLPDDFVQDAVAAAAGAVDAAIAGLPAGLVDAIATGGAIRYLDRSVHRLEHVEQIERALAS